MGNFWTAETLQSAKAPNSFKAVTRIDYAVPPRGSSHLARRRFLVESADLQVAEAHEGVELDRALLARLRIAR